MLKIPVLRWGKPYESLERDEIKHFLTGEPIAQVSQANGGIVQRDMRRAQQARDLLRQIPCDDLIQRVAKAADLYETGTLPMGDGTQSPEDFVRQQSASTGLPEHMCRANIAKNSFVLRNMRQILDCLTRGLPLEILARGWGLENRASSSATRLRRLCWAPCCRPTRRAYTPCGCLQCPCSSAWC